MAEIILINDQDQEETLPGVNEIVCRSSTGDIKFSSSAEGITRSLIDRSISGKYINDSIDKIGDYSFAGCTNLTEVEFKNVITVGQTAFNGCTKLEKASFPNATTLGRSCFLNCTGLVDIEAPKLDWIPEYFAEGCKALTKVVFPLCESLANYSFRACIKLKELDFESLTNISYSVFNGCMSLETLIIRTSEVCKLKSSSSFDSTPIATHTTAGFIYVPDNLVDSYKVSTNWKTFATKIKPLSELPT